MADITITLPVQEAQQSLEIAAITPVALAATNTIKDAFGNKNNSLAIVVQATASTNGKLVFKAGDEYPNAMLGDLEVPVAVGTHVILVEDISRFVTRKGDLVITQTGLTGTIFCTAKRAGLKPVTA